MQPITRKELLEFLESSQESGLDIIANGSVNVNLIVNKYILENTNDEINIKDTISKNYISFNYNEVRNIVKDEDKIIVNIDDNRDTTIIINI